MLSALFGLCYLCWFNPPPSLLLCPSSNKPNPNQLSNNVKPPLVNGAAGALGAVGAVGTAGAAVAVGAAGAAGAVIPGAPGSGQTPGLGRACESCYSESSACVTLLSCNCNSCCFLCSLILRVTSIGLIYLDLQYI